MKIKCAETFKNLIPNDLGNITNKIRNTAKAGWEKGREKSRIDNKGLVCDMFTRGKYIIKEIKNIEFEQKDIPLVAAAIAYFAPIPIPGLTIYVYGIVLGLTKLMNLINDRN